MSVEILLRYRITGTAEISDVHQSLQRLQIETTLDAVVGHVQLLQLLKASNKVEIFQFVPGRQQHFQLQQLFCFPLVNRADPIVRQIQQFQLKKFVDAVNFGDIVWAQLQVIQLKKYLQTHSLRMMNPIPVENESRKSPAVSVVFAKFRNRFDTVTETTDLIALQIEFG